jgi:RNA polymerase sigma-70 factor (ECF subfamily)
MMSTIAEGFTGADVGSDPAVFSTVIEPLLEPARRMATVMLHDRSQAEDAVQEAALKAWRKHHQYRGGQSGLRGWFLAIVANECRMVRRGRWWSLLTFADIPERPAPAEEATVTSSDLQEGLTKLQPDQRAALFLYYYLDLPIDEVARILGVSPGAAKVRIHRAARSLRPHLAEEELLR